MTTLTKVDGWRFVLRDGRSVDVVIQKAAGYAVYPWQSECAIDGKAWDTAADTEEWAVRALAGAIPYPVREILEPGQMPAGDRVLAERAAAAMEVQRTADEHRTRMYISSNPLHEALHNEIARTFAALGDRIERGKYTKDNKL